MLDQYKVRQLEERYQEETIAGGKTRFVRREVSSSVVLFTAVLTLLYFVNGRTESSLFASLCVFPVGVLGGYLSALWKWQDINKRRP